MIRKFLPILGVLLLAAQFLCADGRVALVIGNGAYGAVPKLANPANDAVDVATKLEGLGFSVTRLVDAKLADMEKARQKFADDAKTASMRFFFYAGHGVQSDGTNWLIPTDADVKEDYELKIKAFSVQAVLDGLKASGPGVNIVVLDACRDNPFKATSRTVGGSRGLAVMGTSGSLIVYATAPGSTAADGKGRNGVFTQALLGRLDSPGVSLQEIMTNVAADVADLTKGTQEPWIQASLTKMVYLVTPDEAKARFAARLAQGQNELDALNAQLEKLKQQAGTEQDTARKASRQVEIQKRASIAAQKELETQLLKAEAARQSQAEKDQATMSTQLASFKAEATKREDAIRQAAETKRKELEALQTGQGGILPFILTIETAQSARVDIAKQYEASLATIKSSVGATYDQKLAATGSWTMDPWENDKEFKARVAAEQARLSGEKQANLVDVAAQNEQKKQAALTAFVEVETNARSGLEAAHSTYKGSAVKLDVGAFDRDAKFFPVTLRSNSPDLAYTTSFTYSVKSDTTEELKRRYLEFDAWQKASALFGEIDASVHSAVASGYYRSVDAVRFKAVDQDGEHLLWSDNPERPVAVFGGSADWNNPKLVISYLLALAPGATIAINGSPFGTDRALILNPKAGSFTIRATFENNVVEEKHTFTAGSLETVHLVVPTGSISVAQEGDLWLDGKFAAKVTPTKVMTIEGIAIGKHSLGLRFSNDKSEEKTVSVQRGLCSSVTFVQGAYKIGDRGPAGGLIFYDNGEVSDGWRYLEAAPNNQSIGIQWWNGNYIDIKTGIAVGTGRANTEAIIAAQGRGSYAATLCKNLSIGGFSDWFLPSIFELSFMYTNLKKAGLGGFGINWLWSSSQENNDGDVWYERFSDGYQHFDREDSRCAVRACRAF
jgi:uncharacterized caspase-like protein